MSEFRNLLDNYAREFAAAQLELRFNGNTRIYDNLKRRSDSVLSTILQEHAGVTGQRDTLLEACRATVGWWARPVWYGREQCGLCGYMKGQHVDGCPMPLIQAALAAVEEET